MIVRIVKMEFKQELVDSFLLLFNANKESIRNFPGCNKLTLLQDSSKNVFFTYSIWENESSLERYRDSNLFKEVWKETKSYFSKKPKAWSTEKLFELN